ncbi:MAG: diguanylate cyclase [Giesbergeria sp.]|uniref:sensor domain-containing diguanylate cyclase n=1 Tax=Giesbergeria sp. TaxID=2818473 RepID=UPI00262D05C7|nr:diguanylate cyclase [Giesbergeria sp.]MDD2609196.1 diguanylate cyclase [Giesbergeria sp.]
MATFFGLLSLLVGLPTYLYVSEVYREQLLRDRREYLNALTASAATVIAENLVERRREIELLAQTTLYRRAPLDSPEFRPSLERLKQSYPHYSWIGLADAEGQVRAATSNHLLRASVAQRPWFQQGRTGIFTGDLHEALLLAKLLQKPIQGQPIRFIDFAAPVYDDAGVLRGVLAAHAHWQWAGDVLQVVRPRNAEELGLDLFIVNRNNEVIYPENIPTALKVPTPEQLRQPETGYFHNWGQEQGTLYLTASAAIQNPVPATPLEWRVVARQPAKTILTDVWALQQVILWASGAAGIAFLLLAWLVANHISHPLKRLTSIARRIERGEEKVLFDGNFEALELQRLSNALQGMYSTLLAQKESLAQNNQILEAKVVERTAELQQLNAALDRQARTDALTGLPNRRQTYERLEEEFLRFQRSHEPYSILMLDIDFFKKINDTHGHATGDIVLQQVAHTLRQSVREVDLVGRVGGEEFMVILPMTHLDQALLVAEKIRQTVVNTPIEPVGHITLSLGAQEVGVVDKNPHEAVEQADQCLYQAKQQGRNRVVAFGCLD